MASIFQGESTWFGVWSHRNAPTTTQSVRSDALPAVPTPPAVPLSREERASQCAADRYREWRDAKDFEPGQQISDLRRQDFIDQCRAEVGLTSGHAEERDGSR